jgi:hypothetical protein
VQGEIAAIDVRVGIDRPLPLEEAAFSCTHEPAV